MTSAELQEAIARAQHDLRNPLGHVLGFCEMLLYHVEPLPPNDIREAVEGIYQVSEQMLREMDRVLDPDKPPALPEEVNALKSQLQKKASTVLNALPDLLAKASLPDNVAFGQDVARIAEAADRFAALIPIKLSFFSDVGKAHDDE